MTKMELIQSLDKDKGIQYLLDEAYKIFNNPVVMFDTDYSLIAYTDVSTDDPIWNEIIATGTFSFETQKFFAEECFVDDVANAEKLAILKSDKLKYARYSGNIFNKHHIKVANIVMVECNEALTENEIVAFELFADVITSEVCKSEFYIAYGEAYQEALINRLIDQKMEDKRIYSAHVQILYYGLKSKLYLAVVDMGRFKAQNERLKHYISIFRQKKRDFKYAIYSDYIVMIMSTKYGIFHPKRDLNSLITLFEQENLFVGISSCFENLYEVWKYYNEAVSALQKGLENNINQRVFIYNKDEK